MGTSTPGQALRHPLARKISLSSLCCAFNQHQTQ